MIIKLNNGKFAVTKIYMYKLGIVIPCYNEYENIIQLLEILKVELITNEISTKVLVVDDSSPDGTGNLVQKFILEESNSVFKVELLSRQKKSGLSSAYITGLSKLQPDCNYLLEMDADHSHRPAYIKNMLKEIVLENVDFVIGSRYIKGGGVENWGIHRVIISKAASLYTQLILNTKINDFTGGFNMYKSKIFETVKLNEIQAEGYLFQIELKYKSVIAGFKFVEVPIIFPDRRMGKSKFNKSIIWEALVGVWKLK